MSAQQGLQRFVDAQEASYQKALAEIKIGRKMSHWMWYIFPQIQGLGLSSTSKFYGLTDLDEAREFLRHPVLGGRLVAISSALLELNTSDANRVFGTPDDLKLRSCMTLFAVLEEHPVFQKVLDKFFDGMKDKKTLELIEKSK